MTKNNAISQGLNFTGVYDRFKDEVNKRLVDLRKRYPDCKFYFVSEPDDKLSRGGGGIGYSIYADKRFFAHEQIQRNTDFITKEYPQTLT
jgi:hypothetical protein